MKLEQVQQSVQHIEKAAFKTGIAAAQNKNVQSRQEAAHNFAAAFQAADRAVTVAQADKKQKEQEQKKRQKHFSKEDYEGYNELEDVLSEIDERLERMLEIAKQLDEK
ncbi:hypothetical protein NO2_0377 [Candidatus Termititenax persephonae]|uniref:Uncharacterized protein n=1 Tax=Candidatus Termititenax persephonae TaxID=2218525 RepID=A0A388TFT8_9BACT|nr:hypothetical protein NO2_0377 [Candidatus Termititenax persephonae]